MSETSVQAQFLIPMVTSLAFGVLFATGVTLILVPALYLIAEDARALRLKWFGGSDEARELLLRPARHSVQALGRLKRLRQGADLRR